MQGIKYSLLESLHFLKQFNCGLLPADELDISDIVERGKEFKQKPDLILQPFFFVFHPCFLLSSLLSCCCLSK